MDQNRRWLCLDCGLNTYEGNGNYYFLKDRLWRALVPREQRHGMICKACIQRRAGRLLTPEDFKYATDIPSDDPEDQPMGESDYGIYDSLSPEVRQVIDSAIVEFVAARSRKVVAILAYMHDQAPDTIPPLHDWFYLDRIAELLNDGKLQVLTEGKDLRFHIVGAARSCPDRPDSR
jgi:hypothetical protein